MLLYTPAEIDWNSSKISTEFCRITGRHIATETILLSTAEKQKLMMFQILRFSDKLSSEGDPTIVVALYNFLLSTSELLTNYGLRRAENS
jgi:hypothetical protein